MTEPFLGEIRQISFNFAPHGWALCNGQLLPINQNQALFSLLGTFYGGNGVTTFALPNLQGRAPLHVGPASVLGQAGGESAHTLTTPEMPAHTHVPQAVTGATSRVATPQNNIFANTSKAAYAPDGGATVAMSAQAVGLQGGGQAHENMPPYLTLNFIIALVGIFPSQN